MNVQNGRFIPDLTNKRVKDVQKFGNDHFNDLYSINQIAKKSVENKLKGKQPSQALEDSHEG